MQFGKGVSKAWCAVSDDTLCSAFSSLCVMPLIGSEDIKSMLDFACTVPLYTLFSYRERKAGDMLSFYCKEGWRIGGLEAARQTLGFQ